jgi:hypothetical protein
MHPYLNVDGLFFVLWFCFYVFHIVNHGLHLICSIKGIHVSSFSILLATTFALLEISSNFKVQQQCIIIVICQMIMYMLANHHAYRKSVLLPFSRLKHDLPLYNV